MVLSRSSSLSSTSPSSSRSGSFAENSKRDSIRGMTIELIPNQHVFRETFLYTPSPISTPTDESPRRRAPSNNLSCAACSALASSPLGRRGTTTAPASKRHAVIMPVRHAGPFCRMPAPPAAAAGLPSLPSIGEDCLVEWERRGSLAVAFNMPSPACEASPATPGGVAARAGGGDGDYFSLPKASPGSKFSADTLTELVSIASPSLRSMAFSNRANGRPGTPGTPTREHRSFLRGL